MGSIRILPTETIVVSFYENTAGMHNRDYDVDEILSLILDALKNKNDLKSIPHYDSSHFSSPSDYVSNDLEVLNQAITIMYKEIYSLLITLHIYDKDKLQYDRFELIKDELVLVIEE